MAALTHAAELDRLCVVLVSTRNPLNIGAAARAMSNFGVLHLRVVNPYAVAFREARSAVGAVDLLQRAEKFDSVAAAVRDCTLVVGTTAVRERELQHPLRSLPEGAKSIRREMTSGRVALLFGSEKIGLTNDDLGHCHWLMRIPTREAHGSMNLGQAVAVCVYEIARAAKTPPAPKRTRASAEKEERVSRLLFDVLRASGYVNPRTAASAEQKARRLVRRLDLRADDAELLLGMLRQVAWKLGSGK